MNNLVNYKNKSPFKFCFLIFLYAIGAASIPSLPMEFISFSNIKLEMLIFSVLKILTTIFPVYLIFSIGYQNQFKINYKKFFFSFTVLFPVFLVCINNIPFVAVLSGGADFVKANFIKYLLYFLVCLSIALFEETVFRGIIYPLFKEKTTDFWAIIFSSLIFSLAHLVNAFSLNIGALILQLGYSFLIGCICGVAYSFSKSIYFSIFLHFIYDIGGLMPTYNLVSGNIWNIWSIVATAVLGVITFVYTVLIYFKKVKNESSSTKG